MGAKRDAPINTGTSLWRKVCNDQQVNCSYSILIAFRMPASQILVTDRSSARGTKSCLHQLLHKNFDYASDRKTISNSIASRPPKRFDSKLMREDLSNRLSVFYIDRNEMRPRNASSTIFGKEDYRPIRNPHR